MAEKNSYIERNPSEILKGIIRLEMRFVNLRNNEVYSSGSVKWIEGN